MAPRFAPFIAAELRARGGLFGEPFTGGFNLLPALRPYVTQAICSDIHPGLIALYKAVQAGWEPPENLGEIEYKILRMAKDWTNPRTAFAAFGCSFGAKEFGGYARNPKGNTNYAAQTKRGLLKKRLAMDVVTFHHGSYAAMPPLGPKAVLYLDPPYLGTLGYGGRVFDHGPFYAWAERQADSGTAVFLSEFTAPPSPRWVTIWTHERAVTVGFTRNVRVELLMRVRPPAPRLCPPPPSLKLIRVLP